MQDEYEQKRRIRAVGRVPQQATSLDVFPLNNDSSPSGSIGVKESPLPHEKRNAFRGRFTAVEPGTDMIHIRLDHDHVPEFWSELSFSLEQLKEWLADEGYVMSYERRGGDDDDINSEGGAFDDGILVNGMTRLEYWQKNGNGSPYITPVIGMEQMAPVFSVGDIVFTLDEHKL